MFTFSSDNLPSRLDEDARFRAWRDRYNEAHGLLDIERPDDHPFSLRFSFAPCGEVGVGQFEGTIRRVARTPQHVAASSNDTLCLFLNRGRTRVSFSHAGRDGALQPGELTLFRDWEPAVACGEAQNRMLFVPIPRLRLHALVGDPEDLAGLRLDASKPASRFLVRYLTMLAQLEAADYDHEVAAHAGTALVDLIGLALGATKEAAHHAQQRGLRAARTQEIIARIAARAADPAFTPENLSIELGLSVRTIQDLLHDTGVTFSARVLEQRLQRARAMLSDAASDHMKIAEVARACGFNEVPYFNRCFRRRFGESPSFLRRR